MKKYFIIRFFVILFSANCYCQTLNVGVSNFDLPFIMHSDKIHFSGFDIVMIGHMCERLHETCKLIP
ncbi:Bacterial periplasmic substrate-binding family protein (fragment) [Legionella fallonii LLAP-10]|uniref:Bacterial periplasmic substrate-binding family protein n=1 Tax=Legionella fallonii LLAP-10 TaxID=1212491 RepID=A0A098G443_9GAMM